MDADASGGLADAGAAEEDAGGGLADADAEDAGAMDAGTADAGKGAAVALGRGRPCTPVSLMNRLGWKVPSPQHFPWG